MKNLLNLLLTSILSIIIGMLMLCVVMLSFDDEDFDELKNLVRRLRLRQDPEEA